MPGSGVYFQPCRVYVTNLGNLLYSFERMANDPAERNTADFKKEVEQEKEEAVRKAKEDFQVHTQHQFLVLSCFGS